MHKAPQINGLSPTLADKMNYSQAALFLGVSKRTLARWVMEGQVPHYKVGHRVYFSETHLLRYIESCRKGVEW